MNELMVNPGLYSARPQNATIAKTVSLTAIIIVGFLVAGNALFGTKSEVVNQYAKVRIQ